MKNTFRLLAFSLLACGLLFTACKKNDPEDNGNDPTNPGGDISEAVSLSGSISDNRTLSDLGLAVDYLVDGTLWLEGNAMLTIEPGVTIMFTGSNGGIVVGENQGIRMLGTAAKPIVLCGPTNNTNKGSWDRVIISSARADNAFEYVQFLNGGSGENVVSVNGKLSMKHCTINGSLRNGVDVSGELTAFEGNAINNCNEYPLIINIAKFPQLGSGNTYSGNTKNMIYGDGLWLDEENTTYQYNPQTIPFYMSDGVIVDAHATLKIAAGVEMVFPYDKTLDIYDGCLLQIEGTSGNPVRLHGETNDAGSWNGLILGSSRSTSGGTQLSNVIITGAGVEDGGAIYCNEDTYASLSNITIQNSGSYGMNIAIPYDWDNEAFDFSGYHVTVSGLQFSNCESGNIFERNTEEVYDNFPTSAKKRR